MSKLINEYIDTFVTEQFRPYSIIKPYDAHDYMVELCTIYIDISHDGYKVTPVQDCSRTKPIKNLIDITLKQYKIKIPDNLNNVRINLVITDGVHYGNILKPVLQIVGFDTYPNIVIPDDSFMTDPTTAKPTDWDSMKKSIIKLQSKEKKNIMYFKGADTGCTVKFDNHVKFCIRQKLAQLPYKWLEIDVGNGKVPIHRFSQYKYLLNLPGHQPWSYRFKFLFLMKSLVININMVIIYTDYGVKATKFVNFYDKFFRELVWNEYYDKSTRIDVKNIDYVTINCHFFKPEKSVANQSSSRPSQDNLNYLNDIAFNAMTKQLKNLYEYFEEYNEDYQTIVNNGYERVQHITNDSLLYAYYKIFQSYADRSQI